MNIPGKCDIVPWVYMSSAYGLVIVWERCIVNDKLSTPFDELRWQGRLLIQFSWRALCILRTFLHKIASITNMVCAQHAAP